MKRITAICMAALAAGIAYAGNPDCNALTKESKFTGEAKLKCNSDQVQARKEKLALNTRQAGGNHSAKKCQTLEGCSDPSTQLEATAAGLGGDGGANSGHSYVRLGRVSQ
jgi:hypothetical protein